MVVTPISRTLPEGQRRVPGALAGKVDDLLGAVLSQRHPELLVHGPESPNPGFMDLHPLLMPPQNLLETPNTAPRLRYALMGMLDRFHSQEYPTWEAKPLYWKP